MKIWGAGTARSLRPIWVAEELGLDYELEPIGSRTGETKTAEYTALTRKQKIPFLVDGDVRLSESVAICRYLIDAYPSTNLKPPTKVRDRAKEDEWCCYIYGELDETSLYVMRRHGDLRAIYGGSDEVVKSAADYAELHIRVMAEHLDGRDYIRPQGFSLPDILLVSCIDWALFYGVDVPAVLLDYKKRIAQRPAYQKSMHINYREMMGEVNGAVSGG